MRLDIEPGDILLDIKNRYIIECLDDNRCAKHIITDNPFGRLAMEIIKEKDINIELLKAILKNERLNANIIIDGDYVEDLIKGETSCNN